MQYRYSLPVKKEVLGYAGAVLRILVFGAVLAYLYNHFTRGNLSWEPSLIWNSLSSSVAWAALILMPLNLGLESLKWHYLVSRDRNYPFTMAVKAVFTGLACGLVTPRAVGEYAGRLAFLPGADKLSLAGPLLLSRISQLSVTILFGSAGVYYLAGIWPALACLLVAPILLITVYAIVRKWQFPGRTFVNKLLKGAENVSHRDLLVLVGLSTARYFVFCLQFVLVMKVMTSMDWSLILTGVSWIFIAKSVLPSVNFLGDLGLREFSAVYFFAHAGQDTLPVLTASLVVWAINIALPAILGAVLLFNKKA